MQWVLQEFDDTRKLAEALDRLGIAYTWHKVVPFVGELIPEPVVADPRAIVMFGSYALWRNAEAKGYWPGVFRLRPFVHEKPWQTFMLNGPEAVTVTVREIPTRLKDDGRDWFLRPVDDSKALSGNVRSSAEILEIAAKVLSLDPAEIPDSSLRHDTLLMLAEPVRIQKEWRIWVVEDRVVTHSLYKEGARVTYRHEIDDDALAFAREMVALNPGYAEGYVMDICRTDGGLKLVETNCLNAAGFYAADLVRLAIAIDDMTPPHGFDD